MYKQFALTHTVLRCLFLAHRNIININNMDITFLELEYQSIAVRPQGGYIIMVLSDVGNAYLKLELN